MLRKFDIREAGTTNEWVKRQVVAALYNISHEEIVKIIIAYEPILNINEERLPPQKRH